MTTNANQSRADHKTLKGVFILVVDKRGGNPEIVTTELKDSTKTGLACQPKPGGAGWTPERRAAQSARMHARKPWLKSTGPRSAAGRKVSRMNGLKHGHRSATIGELLKLLAAQKRFVARWRAGRYHPPKRRFSYSLPACGGRMKSPLSMLETLVCLNLARRTMTAANSKGVP